MQSSFSAGTRPSGCSSRYGLSRIALLPFTILAFCVGASCDATSDEPTDPGCGECPPSGASCEDGVVSYRYSWSTTCPPRFGCGEYTHPCTLGCREQGRPEDQRRELVFMLCEEASVRAAGFPCRRDIDCLSPIGATEASRLVTEEAGGPGGALGNAGQLICGVAGQCEGASSPAAYTDIGSGCSIETSPVQPGPVVGANEACESGGCLVLTGGAEQGTCTAGCADAGDCPAGYQCADVLDNRYFTWGSTGDGAPPPRILACVPMGA